MRTLPVRRTVSDSFATLAGRRAAGLRLAGGWWLAAVALAGLGTGLRPVLPAALAGWAGWPGGLALGAGCLAVAAAWQRQVALGDRPRPPFAKLARMGVRLLAATAGAGLAPLAGMLAFRFGGLLTLDRVDPWGVEAGPPLALAGAVVAVIGLVLAPRLLLALPAAAIGDDRLGLTGSWRATRGRLWRLWAVILPVCLPFAVFLGVTAWRLEVAVSYQESGVILLLGLLRPAAALGLAAAAGTVLGLAYRELAGAGPMPDWLVLSARTLADPAPLGLSAPPDSPAAPDRRESAPLPPHG